MTAPARTSWWSVGCLGTGIGLIALPIIGVLVHGPTNPYAALMLAGLGLVGIGAACGYVVHRLALRVAPPAAAVVAGVLGTVPPILPIFGTSSIELSGVALYGLVLGAGNWLLDRRSRPAIAFAGLWAIASVALVVTMLSAP